MQEANSHAITLIKRMPMPFIGLRSICTSESDVTVR